ncbi:hypothetical protein ACNBFH_004445 [Salmonella enterica subsp. enterica serovar Bareilly]
MNELPQIKVIPYFNPVEARRIVNEICRMAKCYKLDQRLMKAGTLANHLIETRPADAETIFKSFCGMAENIVRKETRKAPRGAYDQLCEELRHFTEHEASKRK